MYYFTVVHETTYKDGCWTCSECGKVVQVEPVFKILVKGDQSAVHRGSSGGLVITGLTVSTATPL